MSLAEQLQIILSDTKTEQLNLFNLHNEIRYLIDQFEYKNGSLSFDKFDMNFFESDVLWNKNEKRFLILTFIKDKSYIIFKLLKNDIMKLSNVKLDTLENFENYLYRINKEI